MKFNKEAEEILNSFPNEHRKRAILAVMEEKAYCPSCYSAGYSNCGYFDECGSVIDSSMIIRGE